MKINQEKVLVTGASGYIALHCIFELLNKEYKFFDEIIALPHPRWILQYKSKQKNFYIKTYINTLNKLNYE